MSWVKVSIETLIWFWTEKYDFMMMLNYWKRLDFNMISVLRMKCKNRLNEGCMMIASMRNKDFRAIWRDETPFLLK